MTVLNKVHYTLSFSTYIRPNLKTEGTKEIVKCLTNLMTNITIFIGNDLYLVLYIWTHLFLLILAHFGSSSSICYCLTIVKICLLILSSNSNKQLLPYISCFRKLIKKIIIMIFTNLDCVDYISIHCHLSKTI